MPWTLDDITGVELDAELSEGDVLTVCVNTPAGEIWIIGEIEIDGRLLVAKGVHMHGDGANSVGIANLRIIAAAILDRIDCDEARVE